MANPEPDQTPRKLFIQLSGSPGSGKSTLAHLLAPSLNAIIFSHDSIRSTLLSSLLPFDTAAKLTYEIGWTFATDLIAQNKNIIMDSTCNYQETLDRGGALAKEAGYEYWYVECRVEDEGVLDRRLRERAERGEGMRSQRGGVGVAPVDAGGVGGKGYNRNPVRLEGERTIVVDSTEGTEKCLKEVVRRMGLWEN